MPSLKLKSGQINVTTDFILGNVTKKASHMTNLANFWLKSPWKARPRVLDFDESRQACFNGLCCVLSLLWLLTQKSGESATGSAAEGANRQSGRFVRCLLGVWRIGWTVAKSILIICKYLAKSIAKVRCAVLNLCITGGRNAPHNWKTKTWQQQKST